MTREFLQNFKIGDAQLPKEVIDAIMAENGRDIEAAKKPFADYDSLKEQLATAKDGLKAFEGVDVKDLQGKITQLQTDLAAKETEYQGRIADMEFTGELNTAITAAKGRSTKAITALLDVDALKASKNRAQDIQTALEGLKKDNGYLFETQQTPPPFAPGTGTNGGGGGQNPFSFHFSGVRADPAQNH